MARDDMAGSLTERTAMVEGRTAGQKPQWHYDSIPAGGMERASITGEFFSKNTPLESVIREGIQNSLDAHAAGKGAVKVRVYFSDIGETSLPAKDNDGKLVVRSFTTEGIARVTDLLRKMRIEETVPTGRGRRTRQRYKQFERQ